MSAATTTSAAATAVAEMPATTVKTEVDESPVVECETSADRVATTSTNAAGHEPKGEGESAASTPTADDEPKSTDEVRGMAETVKMEEEVAATNDTTDRKPKRALEGGCDDPVEETEHVRKFTKVVGGRSPSKKSKKARPLNPEKAVDALNRDQVRANPPFSKQGINLAPIVTCLLGQNETKGFPVQFPLGVKIERASHGFTTSSDGTKNSNGTKQRNGKLKWWSGLPKEASEHLKKIDAAWKAWVTKHRDLIYKGKPVVPTESQMDVFWKPAVTTNSQWGLSFNASVDSKPKPNAQQLMLEGEEPNMVDTSKCTIVDGDKNPVAFDDLLNRRIEKVVLLFTSVYIGNNTVGVAKKIIYMKVSDKEGNDEYDFDSDSE